MNALRCLMAGFSLLLLVVTAPVAALATVPNADPANYLSIPNNPSLNKTNPMTIEMWDKSNTNWDAHANWVYLVNKQKQNTSGYGICIDSNPPSTNSSPCSAVSIRPGTHNGPLQGDWHNNSRE